MNKKYIIGIDPDVDRSGVAIYSKIANEFIEVQSCTFFEFFNFISNSAIEYYFVIIEAGWLNEKSNWHGQHGAASERIAKNVGANHEVGRKIVEMCEYLGFDYKVQKPLKKCWSGSGGKITQNELEKLTGFKKRTNQDQRDACLIAWHNKDVKF